MWIEYNTPVPKNAKRDFLNLDRIESMQVVKIDNIYTIKTFGRAYYFMGMFNSEYHALDACRLIISKYKRGEKWCILSDDYEPEVSQDEN